MSYACFPMYFDFTYSPKMTIKFILPQTSFHFYLSIYTHPSMRKYIFFHFSHLCILCISSIIHSYMLAHLPSAFTTHLTFHPSLHVALTCNHFSCNNILKTLNHILKINNLHLHAFPCILPSHISISFHIPPS